MSKFDSVKANIGEAVRLLEGRELDAVSGAATTLPQPQPPGQFPSGNPSTAPTGSNDPGTSSQ